MVSTFDNWETELYHHGIKGQKWGIRRFQNADGTLTVAGQERYQKKLAKQLSKGNGRALAKVATDLDEDGNYKELRKQREYVDKLGGQFSRDRAIQLRYGHDQFKYGERSQAEEYDSYNKAEKAFYKANGYTPEQVKKIRDSFREETQKRVGTMLGKYGDRSVKSIYGGTSSLSKQVADIIDLNITMGLINELDNYYRRN